MAAAVAALAREEARKAGPRLGLPACPAAEEEEDDDAAVGEVTMHEWRVGVWAAEWPADAEAEAGRVS